MTIPGAHAIPLDTPEAILDMANAYQRSRVLLTGVELGVFTALGERKLGSAEIATAVEADQRGVDRLCNALVSLGLLVKEGDLFGNTLAAARYLSRDSVEYLGTLGHASNLFMNWATLTKAVRKGGQILDAGLKERDERWFTTFIGAMRHRGKFAAAEVAALLDLSNVTRMADVGGGSGAFSIAFAQANPKLTAVVLDLPQVVPMAQAYIEEAGLGDRVRTRICDYLHDDFGRGYDLLLFSSILHINAPTVNQQLINKAYAALNPKGVIVVRDFLLSEDRTAPARGALFALNMLVNTAEGDAYTESEIAGWLSNAGCASVRRVEGGADATLLIGQK
jgi:predicted O-methyltransferase YrrM